MVEGVGAKKNCGSTLSLSLSLCGCFDSEFCSVLGGLFALGLEYVLH